MKITGNILKMKTSLEEVIQYQLPIGQECVPMNDLIDKEIRFRFMGQINCIHCGRKTRKSFSQGYCYSCFNTLPQCDVGIVHPELDRSHLGISRDMEWARLNSLTPHYVYLALSSDVKVGVTRASQIPTRWIDQGAVKAIILACTPNRHIAGVIEVALKEFFSDKTNWRKMLSNNLAKEVDLDVEKERARGFLHPELQQYVVPDQQQVSLVYPVKLYPHKMSPLSFEKEVEYSGVLKGIKGQYLLFDDQRVLNIRKHSGYLVELEY